MAASPRKRVTWVRIQSIPRKYDSTAPQRAADFTTMHRGPCAVRRTLPPYSGWWQPSDGSLLSSCRILFPIDRRLWRTCVLQFGEHRCSEGKWILQFVKPFSDDSTRKTLDVRTHRPPVIVHTMAAAPPPMPDRGQSLWIGGRATPIETVYDFVRDVGEPGTYGKVQRLCPHRCADAMVTRGSVRSRRPRVACRARRLGWRCAKCRARARRLAESTPSR
jgi:hypothetical protein